MPLMRYGALDDPFQRRVLHFTTDAGYGTLSLGFCLGKGRFPKNVVGLLEIVLGIPYGNVHAYVQQITQCNPSVLIIK